MIVIGPLLLIVMVGGLLLGYFVLRGQMRAEIAELRTLVEEGKAGRAAEPVAAVVPVTPEVKFVPVPKALSTPIIAPPKPEPVKEEITPEILAVIAAAVAQFVGAGARIRSTRMLAVPEGNAWAQQGRVIIQASHNLAMR
jgi:hypothetical protein